MGEVRFHHWINAVVGVGCPANLLRCPGAAANTPNSTTGSATNYLHPQMYFFLIVVSSCDVVWTKKSDAVIGSYWRN